MKTKIISIIGMLLLTFAFNFIPAKNPETILTKAINSKIYFPSAASEYLVEGSVFVEFKVAEDGKIVVLNCTSLQWQLQNYVFQTISKVTVAPDPDYTGKIFTMRFDFKLY